MKKSNMDYESLKEDLTEYIKILGNSRADKNAEDIAYNLRSEYKDFTDEGLKIVDHMIRYKIINEVKDVNKIDSLAMGDLYGFDKVEILDKISKDVYREILED